MSNDNLNHQSKTSKVLTKFMIYNQKIFSASPGLKVTQPKYFNDPFDSQIQLSQDDIRKLISESSLKLTNDQIQYLVKRLESIHILCFSAKHALSINSSNMWGLYANKGDGIAFEFNYEEISKRINSLKYSEEFQKLPDQIDKAILKIQIPKTNNSLDFPKYYISINSIRESENIKRTLAEKFSARRSTHIRTRTPRVKIESGDVLKIPEFKSTLLAKDLLNFTPQNALKPVSERNNLINTYINVKTSLYEVSYIHNFGRLYDIFNEYLNNKAIDNNLRLLEQFMTHKNIMWQHEQEYRILITDFINDLLEHAETEANNGNYTGGMNILDKKDHQPKIIPFNSTSKLNQLTLPFPETIYLGWNFNLTKNKQRIIERFCKKNKVNLLKLKKSLDFENQYFQYEILYQK